MAAKQKAPLSTDRDAWYARFHSGLGGAKSAPPPSVPVTGARRPAYFISARRSEVHFRAQRPGPLSAGGGPLCRACATYFSSSSLSVCCILIDLYCTWGTRKVN